MQRSHLAIVVYLRVYCALTYISPVITLEETEVHIKSCFYTLHFTAVSDSQLHAIRPQDQHKLHVHV